MSQKKSQTKKAASSKRKPVITIALVEPVQANGETIHELQLRRPKGKDFRKLVDVDMPVGMMLDFAAHLAAVPPSTIDALDSEDVAKVLDAVGNFLGKSPKTGKM